LLAGFSLTLVIRRYLEARRGLVATGEA